ncbi:hypothetical protein QBC33DRAFT_595411 [Phialemonium atrogriseum]|uniref:Uncharacterized protein n=1 Tax=Phialemonium atrogriseum TaxID=1093897 RepID=A0AAJ0BU09_9PEZI|nr:uncharacterized protein QBC33DRAFT_595411 [Phialemonium atrogriseum]KAK1764206.1 hypothetical protein QBC33DRAFT_595411 [Phialemonium atrogriseum]
MSNIVPDMADPEVFPYCIWHPDKATEETYRELARGYPAMRYHFGWACAVAGYTDLYRQLDFLPYVSLAEEARDNFKTSGAIFNYIVTRPVRYAVMDDCTGTVNLEHPWAGVSLNGDSQLRSVLVLRQALADVVTGYLRIDCSFDIMEDGFLGEEDVGRLPQPLASVEDLLIFMAAYEGNVDRDARLRRPPLMHIEYFCIIRGICHNTMFAKWWLDELESRQAALSPGSDCLGIKIAIVARLIMCNDLSLATTAEESDLSYIIWYPLRPRATTLAELARRRPCALRAVAHICVAADCQELYNRLQVTPHPVLYKEAKHRERILSHGSRATCRDEIDLKRRIEGGLELKQQHTLQWDKGPTSTRFGTLWTSFHP